MVIQMPQRPDIFGFIAAHLAVLTASDGTQFAWTAFRRPSLAHHAMGPHVAPDGGVGA